MKPIIPLEIHVSELASFGFFMFFPAVLFLVVGLILLIAKQKKASKVLFIISGSCLIVAIGACGFGA